MMDVNQSSNSGTSDHWAGARSKGRADGTEELTSIERACRHIQPL